MAKINLTSSGLKPAELKERAQQFCFGVNSIDSLLDNERVRLGYGLPNKPFVACIAGPDGVGKSILGMHAASTWSALNRNQTSTRVIYASTDLNYDQASSSWEHFGLHSPGKRLESLSDIDDHILSGPTGAGDSVQLQIAAKRRSLLKNATTRLRWIKPTDDVAGNIASEDPAPEPFRCIYEDRKNKRIPEVGFLDLARFSAGDDWALINRSVGLLSDLRTEECRKTASGRRINCECHACGPPHLLIVDAVEGLEAMVGDHDAYGLPRSRRSRLAQLVRIARNSRCSVVFVIEQREEEQHLDEVFVSDLVLRLRSVDADGYLRKTLEIEKARSVSHVRGQHDLSIRDGRGCGQDARCPDDPATSLNSSTDPLAYLIAMPSLNVRPQTARRPNPGEAAPDGATQGEIGGTTTGSVSAPAEHITLPKQWFVGLDDLNRLIYTTAEIRARSKQRPVTLDKRERTLVCLGDSGTHKSRLGYSFLAGAFMDNDADEPDLPADGGAILFTTENLSHTVVAHAIRDANSPGNLTGSLNEHLIVRQLPPRFLSSSMFLFRVRMGIRKLKARVFEGRSSVTLNDCLKIRVVVDNWTTLLDCHPSMKADPQLLHSLFRLFQEESVVALLIGTQPGSPLFDSRGSKENDLANLETNKVFTWPVNFFGARRIAVTTSRASSSREKTLIYELRRVKDRGRSSHQTHSEKLEVDRHFAIYSDLEQGAPTRIDLRVKLWSGFHADQHPTERPLAAGSDYVHEVSALFGDLFPNSRDAGAAVSFENIERYDGFKEYVQTLDRTQQNHTLLFQVDEFWAADPDQEILADLSPYLNDIVATWDGQDRKIQIRKDRDPGGEFGPIPSQWRSLKAAGDDRKSFLRREAFKEQIWEPGAEDRGAINHVPLHKDLGMLLADRNAWLQCEDIPLDSEIELGLFLGPVRADGTQRTYIGPREEPDLVSLSQLGDVPPEGEESPSHESTSRLRPISDDNAPFARNDGDIAGASTTVEPADANAGVSVPVCVGDVWNALCIREDRFRDRMGRLYEDLGLVPDEPSAGAEPAGVPELAFCPTWEMFLAACRIVSEKTRRPPFDVDLRTSESLTSIILEMWFSSMANSLARLRISQVAHLRGKFEQESSRREAIAWYDEWDQRKQVPDEVTVNDEDKVIICRWFVELYFQVLRLAGRRSPGTEFRESGQVFSLRDWVMHGYTWLFFVIGQIRAHIPRRFTEPDLQLAKADSEAVAFRCWIATAVLSQKDNVNTSPLRLPGRYSVRGDWHLSVAASSRSRLLAFQAIDKLVSKRMNVKRLREGVGLPVRVIDGIQDIETPLTRPIPEMNSTQKLEYRSIRQIEYGPQVPELAGLEHDDESDLVWIRPLFRSRIADYDRHSEGLFRLLTRLLRELAPVRSTGYGDKAVDVEEWLPFELGRSASGLDAPIVEPAINFDNMNEQLSVLQQDVFGAIEDDDRQRELFVNLVRTFCDHTEDADV